jgi:GDPmannose 4,6-dehydratase
MQLMMEAESPQDYVLATGISHRLSFFVQRAFRAAGIDNWQDFVRTEGTSDRPVDTNKMVGNSRSAYLQLGWRHTVDFEHMARAMVEHDIAALEDPAMLWTDF